MPVTDLPLQSRGSSETGKNEKALGLCFDLRFPPRLPLCPSLGEPAPLSNSGYLHTQRQGRSTQECLNSVAQPWREGLGDPDDDIEIHRIENRVKDTLEEITLDKQHECSRPRTPSKSK